MSLELNLASYTKVNSKWIIDLNVKHGIIELLQHCTGENICDLKSSEEFLDVTPKARSMKGKKY